MHESTSALGARVDGVEVLFYALLVTRKFTVARERVHRALTGMRQRLARGNDGGAGAVRARRDDASAFCGCLDDLDAERCGAQQLVQLV